MELKHISPRQRHIIDVSIATALSWKNPDGLKAALTAAWRRFMPATTEQCK